MQTNDPSLLFLTSQQLSDAAIRERKIKAAEQIGAPIKVSSKVLDMTVLGSDGWTAESGWQARRLDLNTGKTKQLYKGHKGPVTSVALHRVGNGASSWLALVTASWDKTIRIWNADNGQLVASLEGHTDFVKSVTVLPTTPPFLLSTSSDRTCRLWNLAPLQDGAKPVCRQVIKVHTRPVETAAFTIEDDKPSTITVSTADSMGVIKEWSINQEVSDDDKTPLKYLKDLPGHETSVATLNYSDDGLWSGSTDSSALLHGNQSIKLDHPAYVKSMLPNPHSLPYILTGSDDEHIRVWDGTAGSVPLSIVPGHCGEVTVLAPWTWDRNGDKVQAIVSASLDGTLRRWTIQDLLQPMKLDYEAKTEEPLMTEEEERELAELLSDDD